MKASLRATPGRSSLLCAVVAWFCLALGAGALHAQSAGPAKIFVASFGNDANDGSRGSPKRNFQAAHDAVQDGGQIVVLDTAGYGTLNMTKSLNVTVPPGVNGFITASGSANGITINASGAVLRGLILEGGGQTGGYGINAVNVTNLVVEDCAIRAFARGISLTTPAAANLAVQDCRLIACVEGVFLATNSGSSGATIQRCRFEFNSGDGLYVGAGTALAEDCVFFANSIGVRSEFSTVRISNCSLTNNGTSTTFATAGNVLSRGNNTVENNGSGTFSGSYSAR